MSKLHACEIEVTNEEQISKIVKLKESISKWDVEFTETEKQEFLSEVTCHRLLHGWNWDLDQGKSTKTILNTKKLKNVSKNHYFGEETSNLKNSELKI
jgi:hypothetical protein